MHAPVLAIGDGALGSWGALREVIPESREQRCRVRKIANVLDAVSTSLRPKVKAALHNIMNAEYGEAADLAIDQSDATYDAKYAKAVDKVLKNRELCGMSGPAGTIRYGVGPWHRAGHRRRS